MLKIPKININYPILAQTTNVEVMKVSPYKFWGANPNEVGNFCIIGHNYRRKGVFSKLHNIWNDSGVDHGADWNRTVSDFWKYLGSYYANGGV